MKSLRACSLLIVSAISLSSLQAQTNTSAVATAVTSAGNEENNIDKHARPVLDALDLNNAEREANLRQVVGDYFKVLDAWHAENDAQIKSLWKQFNSARSKQNETNANVALAKIDGVYVSFKPQHDKFLSALSSVLTPEQVETVKDVLTVNKVKVTFNAYGQIFHGLTDSQNAFILKNLKQAREEAIDAKAMTEKSAFFKKYKIKIEAYLTTQGYDVKQSYKDFVAKQKAEAAAKKTFATPADEEKE